VRTQFSLLVILGQKYVRLPFHGDSAALLTIRSMPRPRKNTILCRKLAANAHRLEHILDALHPILSTLGAQDQKATVMSNYWGMISAVVKSRPKP
jgi:hypothetical protein